MKRIVVVAAVAAVALPLSSCFQLDSFVWNPRHCSLTGGGTPEQEAKRDPAKSDELCKTEDVCTPCGAPLPFARVGIPDELATRHTVQLEDGETNDSWFVAAAEPGPLSDLTIVFSHGNFGGIEHYLNRVALLHRTGANVYAVDYRGFGQSSTDGEPSEAQFLSDTHLTQAGIPAILQEHGVSETAVVLMGFSAGALFAVETAVTQEVCGMVLEAPWPSVDAFTNDSTFIGVPGSFVTTGQWDNITKMESFTKPLLHLHGSEDLTVRIELGEELFAATASAQKEFVRVEGAAHGNFIAKEGELPDVPETLGQDVYVSKIAEFITALDCD